MNLPCLLKIKEDFESQIKNRFTSLLSEKKMYLERKIYKKG